MPFPNVAPGFTDLMDVANSKVTEIGVQQITDAIELSVQLYNDEVAELESTLVERGTEFKERYELPAVAEMQPLVGDTDRPKPAAGGASYERAYPLKDAGHAWGGGRKARAKMTVLQANNHTWTGLVADARWRMRHILAAWMSDQPWLYNDPEHGVLTIGGCANGDATEYVNRNGDGFQDSHYLCQAVAIDAANDPFPTLVSELMEHPENDNGMYPVAYIPTNLVQTVTALPMVYNNLPDVIEPGANVTRLVTEQTGSPLGDKLIGFHEAGIWLVELMRLPNNYIPFHVPGIPFIYMREEPEAELQGLRTELYDDDGVTWVNALIRTAGYAVRNRVAGGVLLIAAGGVYVSPAGFTNPLPQ